MNFINSAINMYRLIATCQYREWYGNDDMTQGRYKNKGCTQHVLFATSDPNEAFNMTKEAIDKVVAEHHDQLNHQGGYTEEYLLHVDFLSPDELTYLEELDQEDATWAAPPAAIIKPPTATELLCLFYEAA